MIKRIVAFILSLIFFILPCSNVYAYKDSKDHDNLMNNILFGSASIDSKSKEILECASYLCLDFVNENKDKKKR